MTAELSSSSVKDGGLTLLTLKLSGAAQKAAEADSEALAGSFEDEIFPFYPTDDHGVFEAVVGVPHNHKPGKVTLTVQLKGQGDKQSLTVPFRVVDAHYPSERLHVDNRHINPKKNDLVEIKRDQAEVKVIYDHVTRQKYWKGPFVYPMKSAITSRYGTKRLFNGQMQSFHGGTDFRAKVGTPIHPAAPGVVVLAHKLFFTGNTVMIDHGYGVITLYAHMSKLKVKKGDEVDTDTLLGLSGKTGRVSGPHLHWQAVVNHVKVNPLDLTRVLH